MTSLAGKMLIAMPTIRDPSFEASVVLLCAHSKQGAMGFVLNKPAPLTMFSDLIETTGLAGNLRDVPDEVLRIPVRLGGPVETFRGFVVHGTDYPAEETSIKIGSSYIVSATLDILRDIAAGRGPKDRLIALGYAGWSPGQLEDEILHNGWLHCEAEDEIIFDSDLGSIYAKALAKLGVNPGMLSSEAGHG
jgi:putative transcriptional regulator